MELAHPLSITVFQRTSPSSSNSSNSKSLHLLPLPKLRPTRECALRMDHANFGPLPALLGHGWAQKKTSSRNIGPLVPSATGSSGAGDEDRGAMETVHKLYTAIKNRNVQEVSDLIGEQVLDFFSALMMVMGKNIEFLIQPTNHGGMNVGVQWKLDWNKTHVPLGKGYSFYTNHIYQGKVVMRDADMFIEPLIHGMEPILLGWKRLFMPIIEKGSPIIKHKRTRGLMYCLITVVLMSTFFTILKRSLL